MFVRITQGVMLLVVAIMAVGCQVPGAHMHSGIPVSHNLPPAQMLMEPGPGVGGPGPGVLAAVPGGGLGAGGQMGGCGPDGAMYGGPGPMGGNVQVKFDRPAGMQVNWDVTKIGAYDSTALVVPGRQNFAQGGVFRLKLTNIEGREGVELYPSLEVGPVTSRTAAYLAHSAIPIQFTEEDFDQVSAGNFVTKVIYVPDPEYQELAFAGIDTLVSTRLDPGVDPVIEADRRGSILAVIRMGNKDMEVPGSEMGIGMDATIPGSPAASALGYVSGVSGPAYGMPYTGTQIGLPGPPHIPLGGPAGLQRYTIDNHTAQLLPGPTENVNVHVKQKPGLSYPRPADKVLIQERTMHPSHFNNQPPADMIYGDIPPSAGMRCPACGGAGCDQCR